MFVGAISFAIPNKIPKLHYLQNGSSTINKQTNLTLEHQVVYPRNHPSWYHLNHLL